MDMSLHRKEHDVFISFRGEDTRTNFTSHLHSALKRAGIRTYIDDECLKKGGDVPLSLLYEIGRSHVAVVVFSKNYASSKWCLQELVEIIRRRRDMGLVVIPVFYEVDPSDIRNRTGTYGEALAKHERELWFEWDPPLTGRHDTLLRWEAALTEAANISGRDTRSREYKSVIIVSGFLARTISTNEKYLDALKEKNESQVIGKIVEDVLQTLELRFPNELKVDDLIGFDKIHKDVKLLLSKNKSRNVQVIGIWGMGGIGKTTIAKAMFSQLIPGYDNVCFLENVREASQKAGQSKLSSLREKLLSELLKDDHLNSTTSMFIRRRLSSKKVLVVLDDVDKAEQLEVLFGECSYAGPDSKLIITTRNKHLLRGIADEDDIYEVKTWSFEESLELFCLTAFKRRHPKKGYEDLSTRAVVYAGGVPLALKVLGSNLGNRSSEFWDSELNKVKDYPYDGIQNVLCMSYDGLHILEKKIFLDIAFFFKGENKDFIERILNACGFFATSGLKILEDKALITISSGKTIQMHDLIQDMGLSIVRQGIKDPGKRSRLKDIEEISDVLEYKKKGSDAVEGIQLDLSQIDDLQLHANAFSMMSDLRFLKLYIPFGKTSGNMDYPLVLSKFLGKLRYLEWHGYCLKSLPDTLCTKMLVEIRMRQSHITELWHGVKRVENLEVIDLSECKHLENLPDLSKASKLKWVNLSGCESLAELHPSILSLDTLETLILDGCKKLSSLKSEKHLRSLKKIIVNGCTSLKEFSVSSDEMDTLDLNNAGIVTLHSSIGRSSKLRSLNLECLGLQNLPHELSFLRGLQELRISNCSLLVLDKLKLHALFDSLRSLQLIYLKDCFNLFELPDNISVLSYLRELGLDGSSVETLPASIKRLTNLETLSLRNCKNLKTLPELPARINELYAVNCTSLVTVSTLETFADVITGKMKYISFENCMKLDEPSRHRIVEVAHLAAMNAMIKNVDVKVCLSKNTAPTLSHNLWYEPAHLFCTRHTVEPRSFTYNFLKVCSPGSSVPGNFTYRTTKPYFTIILPSYSMVLGLILCVVLSPLDEMKEDGAKIFCQLYKEDGTKAGYPTRWSHEPIRDLNSDHVYIWHETSLSDRSFRDYDQHITVEFYATNDSGIRDVLKIGIKECGANLIFASVTSMFPSSSRTFDSDPPKLPGSLQERDFDSKSIRKLALKLGSKLKRTISLQRKTK